MWKLIVKVTKIYLICCVAIVLLVTMGASYIAYDEFKMTDKQVQSNAITPTITDIKNQ